MTVMYVPRRTELGPPIVVSRRDGGVTVVGRVSGSGRYGVGAVTVLTVCWGERLLSTGVVRHQGGGEYEAADGLSADVAFRAVGAFGTPSCRWGAFRAASGRA